ncbi:MAG: mechanosensitive ion channel [Methanothrix sp.]|nr:mechanosensitive ion channel [Methanothrix sp.]
MPFMDQIFHTFGPYSPNLVGALAVLIVGWLVALIVSSIIGKALHSTGIDEKIARKIVGEEKTQTMQPHRWISKIIYYVLLFFVFVAFFQVLGLTLVADPLNRLLNIVFSYIPKLFAALVLVVIAWVIATVLKKVVLRVLLAAKVDESLGRKTGLDKAEMPLSQTMAEIVFFLVLLLFLPMILNTLALGGLLEPLQLMIGKILLFLPNLLAAAIILIIGWFVARILQKIVTNLLIAMGSERLSEKVGLAKVLGSQGLAGLIGLIVYILILIPVLIAALQALAIDAITLPISNMLAQMLAILPSLFGAALVLAVAFILGKIIAELAARLLAGMGFDSLPERLGLAKAPVEGARKPSQMVGYIVIVAIMLFALIEAARMLKFDLLADIIFEFTVFAGHVLMGLIIFAIGIYLANLAFNAVISSGMSSSKLPAHAARIAILVFAGAMALRQMGLANEIINLAFGLLLGAIAVAVALAFGLGGKEIAAQEIRKWLEGMK